MNLNKCKFYIVDVFAERKYEGNQLAVFLSEDTFSDSEMQKIAREMGQNIVKQQLVRKQKEKLKNENSDTLRG